VITLDVEFLIFTATAICLYPAAVTLVKWTVTGAVTVKPITSTGAVESPQPTAITPVIAIATPTANRRVFTPTSLLQWLATIGFPSTRYLAAEGIKAAKKSPAPN
jgi:hypothetical protein